MTAGSAAPGRRPSSAPVVEHAESVGFGAVGGGRSRVLQIPGFRLGPFPFETLIARYIEDGGDGFEGRRSGYGSRIRQDTARYDGILGSEVLNNFVITTDLKNRRIHFGLR
ncbi:MAG: hypothetical protein RQ847_08865 [Wenzhouxiangellaceae bacterium]|nr:hypothetical protein [Wenzhouxiangellaceae bacterium]